jgi:hypothetical protein
MSVLNSYLTPGYLSIASFLSKNKKNSPKNLLTHADVLEHFQGASRERTLPPQEAFAPWMLPERSLTNQGAHFFEGERAPKIRFRRGAFRERTP